MLIDSCCPWQKHKGLDADAKFEFAKRKLQASYQQHDKGLFLLFNYFLEKKINKPRKCFVILSTAKKQRTIQVLETIPKQCGSAAQKPQLKRPGMKNRSWSNGRK